MKEERQEDEETKVLCPGCDIKRFIETAGLYREFFVMMRDGFKKRGYHRSPKDHLRKRLDVYIDVCDRIIKEFPRL